jgi:hypothetical protein
LAEALRVARAQYDAFAKLETPKGSWADREQEIRNIYINAMGMDEVKKQEYFRSLAENNKNGLLAIRDALDKVIASHPENKNAQAGKTRKK